MTTTNRKVQEMTKETVWVKKRFARSCLLRGAIKDACECTVPTKEERRRGERLRVGVVAMLFIVFVAYEDAISR